MLLNVDEDDKEYYHKKSIFKASLRLKGRTILYQKGIIGKISPLKNPMDSLSIKFESLLQIMVQE